MSLVVRVQGYVPVLVRPVSFQCEDEQDRMALGVLKAVEHDGLKILSELVLSVLEPVSEALHVVPLPGVDRLSADASSPCGPSDGAVGMRPV